MTQTTHRLECSADTLSVALELSTREWLLTMSVGPEAKRYRAQVRPGDRAALEEALRMGRRRSGLAADAPVWSCYEAGREGFWPARLLAALGVTNVVVDSSSIEVPRRARRAKTDRLDGEKLLRLLLRHARGERGVWQVVRVPSVEAEDGRHASRALTTLQADRTRVRNRIQSLLALHGVRLRIRWAVRRAPGGGPRLGGGAAAAGRAGPRPPGLAAVANGGGRTPDAATGGTRAGDRTPARGPDRGPAVDAGARGGRAECDGVMG